MNGRANQPSIIDLDRKVSRAMETGRSITLTPDHLDLLASIGMIEQLAEAKAKYLKEQAQCRQLRAGSISGAASGSTSIAAPEENPRAQVGTSSGTIQPADTTAARARALQTFGSRATS